MFRILAFLLLPVICLAQVNSKVEKPTVELLSNEISPNDMKRNASFNLDEIKVRWKKAALENCTGVPCVVIPPAPSFTCGTSTISDVDGNVYETVSIGNQCWTKQNLKVSMYNDGTLIPDETNSSSNPWAPTSGARTENKEPWPGPSTSVSGYVGTLGYLYNWYAVNDSRKLCPNGWHVPTDAEWTTMIQALNPSQVVNGTIMGIQSTTVGNALKSDVTNTSIGSGLGWNPGSTGTNTSGFSALPGGYRTGNGFFNNIRIDAIFWSATEDVNIDALVRSISNNVGNVYRNTNPKSTGNSVRCLRD